MGTYSIVQKSQLEGGSRIDAEYYQSEILNFLRNLSLNRETKILRDLVVFINHAKQPPYVDRGEIPIITQRHLGDIFVNLEALDDPDTKYTSREWLKLNPKFKLCSGDILYYSVGAYIGKTNIILEDIEATSASFITIIRANDKIDPLYLAIILNSQIGMIQSKRWKSASAQPYIYPKDIKNFVIPLLSKTDQQKIANLVRQSYEARRKAKELLNQVKQKVEELIKK